MRVKAVADFKHVHVHPTVVLPIDPRIREVLCPVAQQQMLVEAKSEAPSVRELNGPAEILGTQFVVRYQRQSQGNVGIESLVAITESEPRANAGDEAGIVVVMK